MKTRVYYFIISAFLLVVLTAFNNGGVKYSGGAPAGYTNSPSDAKNCTYCHNGTATQQEDIIISDVGSDGYIPGEAYTISVVLSGSGDKGFEVSPQDSAGNLLGTLEAGEGSKLVGGGKYITQSAASNDDPKVWEFTWLAPEQGTGEVVFYGAFTVNMPVTKLSTLVIPEKNTTGVFTSLMEPVKIYPNPASEELFITNENDIPTTIDLYNIRGVLVSCLSEQTFIGSGVTCYIIPQHIKSGVYFVVIRQNGKSYSKKVIIE